MLQKKIVIALLILGPLFSLAQAGSEIYLFNLSFTGTAITLTDPVNISNHKGYDNQPFFHPASPLIYFSSFDDSGRSDIKYYNYKSNSIANLTTTHEREYSPTVTPDKKYISCILQRDNNAQDLVQYPIGGGSPSVLINTLIVGYHAWINSSRLLLFVLKDSLNELHYYDLSSKQDKIIAQNPGRSLQKIPGEDAMSFIEKTTKENWTLKRFDNRKGIVTVIALIPPMEDMTWVTNRLVLFSKENQVLVYDRVENKWATAIINADQGVIKKITRLVVSPGMDKIAIVVAE
ncbi:MAG: hypothetical protein JWN76_1327 [Chitinophagaceae bacterium]|nr:hypothetical protein [Chitinophagaceae bacterium]